MNHPSLIPVKTFKHQLELPLDTSERQQQIERLKALLLHHDWTYLFSDDHKVYQRGYKSACEINSLANSLGDIGEALFQQYKKDYQYL